MNNFPDSSARIVDEPASTVSAGTAPAGTLPEPALTQDARSADVPDAPVSAAAGAHAGAPALERDDGGAPTETADFTEDPASRAAAGAAAAPPNLSTMLRGLRLITRPLLRDVETAYVLIVDGDGLVLACATKLAREAGCPPWSEPLSVMAATQRALRDVLQHGVRVQVVFHRVNHQAWAALGPEALMLRAAAIAHLSAMAAEEEEAAAAAAAAAATTVSAASPAAFASAAAAAAGAGTVDAAVQSAARTPKLTVELRFDSWGCPAWQHHVTHVLRSNCAVVADPDSVPVDVAGAATAGDALRTSLLEALGSPLPMHFALASTLRLRSAKLTSAFVQLFDARPMPARSVPPDPTTAPELRAALLAVRAAQPEVAPGADGALVWAAAAAAHCMRQHGDCEAASTTLKVIVLHQLLLRTTPLAVRAAAVEAGAGYAARAERLLLLPEVVKAYCAALAGTWFAVAHAHNDPQPPAPAADATDAAANEHDGGAGSHPALRTQPMPRDVLGAAASSAVLADVFSASFLRSVASALHQLRATGLGSAAAVAAALGVPEGWMQAAEAVWALAVHAARRLGAAPGAVPEALWPVAAAAATAAPASPADAGTAAFDAAAGDAGDAGDAAAGGAAAASAVLPLRWPLLLRAFPSMPLPELPARGLNSGGGTFLDSRHTHGDRPLSLKLIDVEVRRLNTQERQRRRDERLATIWGKVRSLPNLSEQQRRDRYSALVRDFDRRAEVLRQRHESRQFAFQEQYSQALISAVLRRDPLTRGAQLAVRTPALVGKLWRERVAELLKELNTRHLAPQAKLTLLRIALQCSDRDALADENSRSVALDVATRGLGLLVELRPPTLEVDAAGAADAVPFDAPARASPEWLALAFALCDFVSALGAALARQYSLAELECRQMERKHRKPTRGDFAANLRQREGAANALRSLRDTVVNRLERLLQHASLAPAAVTLRREFERATDEEAAEAAAARASHARPQRAYTKEQRAARAAAAADNDADDADDADTSDDTAGHELARLYLERCADLMPMRVYRYDDRARHFRPDPWQTALLEAVDQGNASVLVTAPTSSGKTFLSYYVVRKYLTDLEGFDDNVVVMVAPTKALANQMTATLHAKFTKNGHPVWGIFTSDYRVNETNCQVLVVVPAILEILLLSPTPEALRWRKRIKFIIFDEAHHMFRDEEGETWERCIMMAPCPVALLSATLADPASVRAWLQALEAQKAEQEGRVSPRPVHHVPAVGLEVRRPVDIVAWAYVPGDHQIDSAPRWPEGAESWLEQLADGEPEVWRGLSAEQRASWRHALGDVPLRPEQAGGTCVRLHPLFASDLASMCRLHELGDSPTDVSSLTPADMLALYDALQRVLRQAGQRLLLEELEDTLSPAAFFRGSRLTITKQRAWDYERALLRMLGKVACEEGTQELALRVRTELCGDALHQVLRAEQRWTATTEQPVSSYHYMRRHVLHVVQKARQAGHWPALVFCLDRMFNHTCVRVLVESMLEQEQALREEEAARRLGGRLRAPGHAWQQWQAEYEAEVVALEQQRREAQAALPDCRASDEVELIGRVNELDGRLVALRREYDTLAGPQSAFTFADPGVAYPADEVKVLERALTGRNARAKVPGWIMEALRRGIGIHDSGLPTKYRQLVEWLFRLKFVRVVFATGTLAVGVDMPCRASIVVGDSLHMTPLDFRQMLGRAGRRGMDPDGHAYMCALPLSRLQRLLQPSRGVLSPSYPLTPQLVLRAVNLSALASTLAARDLNELAQRAGAHLLQLLAHVPLARFAAGDRAWSPHAAYLLIRFAAEYVAAERLVDEAGNPQLMAGLVQRLHYFGASIFALQHLIRSGVLMQVLNLRAGAVRGDHERAAQRKQLVCVLAHLFFRLPMHSSHLRMMEELGRGGMEQYEYVRLPPLHPAVAAELQHHNHFALQLFVRYAGALACAGECPPLERLPLHASAPVPAASTAAAAASGGLAGLDHHGEFGARLPAAPALWQAVAGSPAALQEAFQPSAWSTFATIAGSRLQDVNWDDMDPSRLLDLMRHDLPLDAALVPVLAAPRHDTALNGYLLGFFVHGQLRVLQSSTGNRMPSADTWERLHDFYKLLQTLSSYLRVLVGGRPESDSDEEWADATEDSVAADASSEAAGRGAHAAVESDREGSPVTPRVDDDVAARTRARSRTRSRTRSPAPAAGADTGTRATAVAEEDWVPRGSSDSAALEFKQQEGPRVPDSWEEEEATGLPHADDAANAVPEVENMPAVDDTDDAPAVDDTPPYSRRAINAPMADDATLAELARLMTEVANQFGAHLFKW